MRTALTPVLLALAMTPAACAPAAVHSDRDETIPIPQGASWAWATPDTTHRWDRDPILGNEIAQQRYARAMEAAMAAKGFHKADAATADFLLSYHIGDRRGGAGTRSAVMVGFGVGGGWGRPYRGFYRYGWDWPGWGWGLFGPPIYAYGPYSGPGGVPYRAGVLFVVLRQRDSGDVAWQAHCALEPGDTQRTTERHVRDIVDRLFADLP